MECTFASTKRLERDYAVVTGRAFRGDAEFRDHKLDWLKRPRYVPEHSRIVVDDGDVVAGVAIVELPVRYGDATLRLGGISAVATDPDRQKRGYGRACMQDTVDYLAEDGYDMSFLLGIRDYYPKFGYRTALVWASTEIDLRSINVDMPKGWRARRMTRRDIPAMAALYEETIGTCDLSVRREEQDWRWYFSFHRMGREHDRVILDDTGRLVGYFAASGGGQIRVNELAALDDERAYEATVAELQKIGHATFGASARVFSEPDGGFERWCLYRKCCKRVRDTDYAGGPMLRLFNLDRLFSRIGDTLARRWDRAPRDTPGEAVTLDCPLGRVALVPRDGGLMVGPGESAGTTVKLPDEALTELVLGFRPARDILLSEGIRTTDSALKVIESVFPVQVPFLPPTDHM